MGVDGVTRLLGVCGRSPIELDDIASSFGFLAAAAVTCNSYLPHDVPGTLRVPCQNEIPNVQGVLL